MRIACPSCTATYEVPASRMKPNRMVRCERCGNEWAAVPEADAEPGGGSTDGAEMAPADADHEAHNDPPALAASGTDRFVPPPAPTRSIALTAAWAASFAVLAGALAASIIWRADVVRAWPPSAWILGAPPPAAGPGASAPGSAPSGPIAPGSATGPVHGPVRPAGAKPDNAGPPRG